MKVLVDTSVWSLVLRRAERQLAPEALMLKEIISAGEQVYLIGVILAEILQGVRDKKQFELLKTYLEPFPILPMERDLYIRAAQLSNQCRQSGIQTSTVDLLIATAAIEYNCYLLTIDQDFTQIAKVVPLKLLPSK